MIDGRDTALYTEPAPIDPASDLARRVTFYRPATAIFRGYGARWAVREGQLYLADLIGRVIPSEQPGPSWQPWNLALSPLYYPNHEMPDQPTWIQWDYFVSAYYYGEPEGLQTYEVDLAGLHGTREAVLATWVSETLYLPWGERIEEHLMARYRYTPSHFRRLSVAAGQITSDRVIPNRSRQPFPPRARGKPKA